MTSPVHIMKPAWKHLSMLNNSPILYNNHLYPNMYKLIYCIAFPSRKDEILELPLCKLRDLRLGLEYFEVDEKKVLNELIKIIIQKCREDPIFLKVLKNTKDRKIINTDFYDSYFGFSRNFYGKCLMKVRNEKLYISHEEHT